MKANQSCKKKSFVHEVINLFQKVDSNFDSYLNGLIDKEKCKYQTNIIKTLRELSHDEYLDPNFRLACSGQINILLLEKFPNDSFFAKDRKKTWEDLKNSDPLERELFLFIISLLRSGPSDIISADGRKTDLLLNVLICYLVEYYKKENSTGYFSKVAKLFDSSLFQISGWGKSKHSSRKKIFDRYESLQKQYEKKIIVYSTTEIFSSISQTLGKLSGQGIIGQKTF